MSRAKQARIDGNVNVESIRRHNKDGTIRTFCVFKMLTLLNARVDRAF